MDDLFKFRFVEAGYEDETGPNDAVINTFSTDFIEVLVRESVQNSLDAAIDPDNKEKPVIVSFKFGSVEKSRYPEIFSLRDHAKGCLDKWATKGRTKEIYGPMVEQLNRDELKTIEVTDRNTKGMSNMPNENGDMVFKVFTQSVGVDVKPTTASGGSYGFGKAAFYQMSPVRTILVSSKTPSGEENFAGVARYCHHSVDGIKYTGKGYYSPHEDFTPAKGDEIPGDFRLDETGTRVTILGHYDDTWSSAEIEAYIAKMVIGHFWPAIVEQKLTVEIGNGVVIDKSSLERQMRSHFSTYQKSKPREYSPLPYYEAYTHIQDETHKRYSKIIDHVGLVELYLFVPEDAKKDGLCKFRKQMMLIEKKESRVNTGYYAVLVCRDEEGNKYLSSIENAQHNKWSTDGKTGEELFVATKVINDLEEFVNASISKSFEVTSERTTIETGVEDFMTRSLDVDNPFNGNQPLSKAQEPDAQKKERTEGDMNKGMIGEIQSGKLGDDEKKKIIEKGKKKRKRIKPSDGEGTAERGERKKKTIDSNDGGKFILFHPTRWNAPGRDVYGVGHQYLTLHSDEELENVLIDIIVNADSARGANVAIKSVVGASLFKKDEECTRLLIDKLRIGRTTIEIVFDDEKCHSIMLK